MLFLLFAGLVLGDTFKLYLKDGDYHLVREYQVQGDRIRYYSIERGEWEEIPKALVDLEKTDREHQANSEAAAKEAQEQDEEDKAEREQRREIASIPMDAGAYLRVGEQIKALPLADYQVITSKKRKTLQVLSPIPIVPGKASVVIQGEHAKFVVTDNRPNFYLRLAKQERFDLAELDPVAADLDLMVGPAEELELAFGRPAHQIAGPVHPSGRRKRIRDEALGIELGPGVVAAHAGRGSERPR